MKTPIEKLTKCEYFTVYGISLLMDNPLADKSFLLICLLPIAKKYYNITMYALRSELRYFLAGGKRELGDSTLFINAHKNLLERWHIKNWKKERQSLSIDRIIECFFTGEWGVAYGGSAWGKIAQMCKKLKIAINNKKLDDIVMIIDRLNDLEHNSSLYLSAYTTFNFSFISDYRESSKIDTVISWCDSDIAKMYRELRGRQ